MQCGATKDSPAVCEFPNIYIARVWGKDHWLTHCAAQRVLPCSKSLSLPFTCALSYFHHNGLGEFASNSRLSGSAKEEPLKFIES
jgi:hypothetical protein